MLKFLSAIGVKPLHPLTNAETISRWMDDLPMSDSVQVIEALTAQIKEYINQKQAVTDERLAVLSTLDQGAQDMLDMTSKQYLQNPRMSKTLESRLWHTVNSYHAEIIRAYHAHIMEYIGNRGSSKIAAAIPLLTTRVLGYFSRDAKWSYYRYTQTNPKQWKRMHNLYRFAEHQAFATRSMKLYETEESETSVARQYLQALLLEMLNTGSLMPRQINLIESWLPMLIQGIRLEPEYDPERHAFYVNLDENHGARRVPRVLPSAQLRFWDTFGVKEKLDALRSQLTAGVFPAKLGLTEDCRLPSCLELLERLSYFWSPTPVAQTQRAFERKHCVKPIDVVRGLDDICWNVRADNLRALQAQQAKNPGKTDALSYDAMVDVHVFGFVTQRTQTKTIWKKEEQIENALVHERWVMENESLGGYGAHITDQADDWLRLGKLVGLKPAQKGYWNVGVIRRMLRTQAQQYYVGIEVLIERPIALMLRTKKSEQRLLSIDGLDTPGEKTAFPALFLKGAEPTGKIDALILHSSEFACGRELWFNARGATYQIKLKSALEQGDDWLRASFEILAKDTQKLAY